MACGVLSMVGMNSLAFEIKRAHWGMNMTAMQRFKMEAGRRKELRWMTPARFDVLFVILQRMEAQGARPSDELSISLGELVIKLGMHKTTIGRTVRMMVPRGFVKCVRDTVDRRQTIVVMTELGLRAIRSALELLRFEPNFIVERIRYWLRTFDEDVQGDVQRAQMLRIRTLARLFGRWAYPIYFPDFDPLAEYRMIVLDPPPEFSDEPMLCARRRVVRPALSR